MSRAFNLTAQINLQAPSNLRTVVAQIRREIGTVTANVDVRLDARSARSIDTVRARLTAMNDVLVQSRQNADALSATFRNLASSLSNIQSGTTRTATGVNNVATNLATTAKAAKQATTEMEEFGKQSALAIRRFAAFSFVTSGIFALINAVNSGVKAFIDFDKEMIKLQQVTGKGVVGLRGLEKEISSLAISLGVSSKSLVDVATTLAQAGLTAEETRQALSALAKTELAPSFDNLTDTTEGAIAAMRQFDIQAKDLEKSLGSINAVAAAFAVESKDIIAAIQRTGGVFAAASKGVSEGSDALNEFIAIFTSVRATTRESAETIATGLRTIFTRIQRAKTIDQLRDFGVELTDLEGKFVGPYEAVKRLSAALSKLDPRDLRFSQIVEELGGFRQIGKVIPLIQQFATAQDALKVAQKGQGSLTEAQVTAQKSLANQLAKVREQFLLLIRDVGKSQSFQALFKIIVGMSRGLISLANAFKPILPVLAIFGAIKGLKAANQFTKGFIGGIRRGGGAAAAGNALGGAASGANQRERDEVTQRASVAITDNTTATVANTAATQALTEMVRNMSNTVVNATNALANVITRSGGLGGGGNTLNGGGIVRRFARGGVVPGSGDTDSVPAMLMPGEFVIRKNAVKTIGAENLHRMNKYAGGGIVNTDAVGAAILKGEKTKEDDITTQDILAATKNEENKKYVASQLNKNKHYTFVREPLSKEAFDIFDKGIENGLVSGLNSASDNISKKLKIPNPAVPEDKVKNFIAGLNDASKGNLFEQIISSMINQGNWEDNPDPQRPFDFLGGLGEASSLFPSLSGIYYADGKASMAAASKENMANKIGNQILEEGGKRTGRNSTTMLDAFLAIKDQLPKDKDFTVDDINQKLRKSGRAANFKGIKELEAQNIVASTYKGKYKLLASGGSVEDSVPALLTPGEFVVNKKAAQRIGYAKLHQMNKADKLQGFNKGGMVGGVQKFASGGQPYAAGFIGSGGLDASQSFIPLDMLSTQAGRAAEQQNKANEELEYLTHQAEYAGQSLKEFAKSLSIRALDRTNNTIKERNESKTDLRMRLIANASSLQGRADNDPTIAAARGVIGEGLSKIDPNAVADKINAAVDAIVKGLQQGDSITKIIEANKDVADIFNKTYTQAELLEESMASVGQEVGLTSDQMKKLTDTTMRQQQFIRSTTGQKFGRLSEMAPDAVSRFASTRMGQRLAGASDINNTLFGKGLGLFGKKMGGIGAMLDKKFESVGGSLTAFGAGLSMAGDKIPELLSAFGAANSTTGAAVAGGITGAGQGLASGALLGGQIAGPVGALIAGVGGAIISGLKGALNAYQDKQLENTLKALDKTASDLDITFRKLENSFSQNTFEEAQARLKDSVQGNVAINQTAQFGAGGIGRGLEQALEALDVTGLGAALSGASQRPEARQAYVKQIGLQLNNAEKLGSLELSRVSTGSITNFLDSLPKLPEKRQDQTDEEYKAENAGAIDVRNTSLARANQTYQQLSKAGMSEEDIFLSKFIEAQAQQGRTPDQISQDISTEEGRKKAIQTGKELLAVDSDIALKQQVMTRAARQLAVATENLIDIYRRAQSGLERYGQDLERFEADAINRANTLTGGAKIKQVDRSNEEALGNISAYSMDEVKRIANQTASIAGGGDAGETLKNNIISAKILRDELPKALRGATGNDVSEVVDKIEEGFKASGVVMSDEVKRQLTQNLENKMQSRQGNLGLADLSEDISFIEDAVKGSEAALKTAQMLQKAYNDTIQSSINLLENYNDKLDEAGEWQRKSTDIRLNAELNLAKALGKSPIVSQLNKPFEANISSLTSGLIPGGSTDPDAINRAMQSSNAEIQRLNNNIKENQNKVGQPGQDDRALNQSIEADQRAVAKHTRAINNGNKALQELANNSERASNALEAIQAREQLGDNARNVIEKLLTSDPFELAEYNRQLGAYTKVISGKASGQEMGNLQFRKDAFGGLNALQGLMPDDMFKQMQATTALKMIESGPNSKEILGSTIGYSRDAQTGELKKMTVEDALKAKSEGKLDPVQQAQVDMYNQAIEAQRSAANHLADNALKAAEQLNMDIKALFAGIETRLAQILPNAQKEAQAEPKPEVKPVEDKPIQTAPSSNDKKPPSSGVGSVLLNILGTVLGTGGLAVGAGALLRKPLGSLVRRATGYNPLKGMEKSGLPDAVTDVADTAAKAASKAKPRSWFRNIPKYLFRRFRAPLAAGAVVAAGAAGAMSLSRGSQNNNTQEPDTPTPDAQPAPNNTSATPKDQEVSAKTAEARSVLLDGLQSLIQLGGLVPGFGEPLDLINAGIYSVRAAASSDPNMRQDLGVDAGLSAASAIPVGGWAASAAQGGRTGVRIGKATARMIGAGVETGVMVGTGAAAETIRPGSDKDATDKPVNQSSSTGGPEATYGSTKNSAATIVSPVTKSEDVNNTRTVDQRPVYMPILEKILVAIEKIQECSCDNNREPVISPTSIIPAPPAPGATTQLESAQTNAQTQSATSPPVYGSSQPSTIKTNLPQEAGDYLVWEEAGLDPDTLDPTKNIIGNTPNFETASHIYHADKAFNDIATGEIEMSTPGEYKSSTSMKNLRSYVSSKYGEDLQKYYNFESMGGYNEQERNALESKIAQDVEFQKLVKLAKQDMDKQKAKVEASRAPKNSSQVLNTSPVASPTQPVNPQSAPQQAQSQSAMIEAAKPESSSLVTATTTTPQDKPAEPKEVLTAAQIRAKQRALKNKGIYRINAQGLPVGRSVEEENEYNKNLTPYEKMMRDRRQAFLARQQAGVRNRYMTKEDKAAQRAAETQNITGSVAKPEPASATTNMDIYKAALTQQTGFRPGMTRWESASADAAELGSLLNGPIPTSIPASQRVPSQTAQTSNNSPSNTGSASAYTVTLDDSSRQFMDSFSATLNGFGTYIDKLAAIKLPDTITMKGEHIVDVRISGAAAFEGLKKDFNNMIQTEISKKMNVIWKQSGGKLGESPAAPTVDSNQGKIGQGKV